MYFVSRDDLGFLKISFQIFSAFKATANLEWTFSRILKWITIAETLYERQYVFFYIIHSKVDVVMKYHESVLEDFSGVLMIDSHSNAFLNLTLINTMGSVHGTISTINYTQVSKK